MGYDGQIRQRRSAQEWSALGLVCPRCHASLCDAPGSARSEASRVRAHSTRGEGVPNDDATLECTRCESRYPSCAGIPDLRVGEDPYLSRGDDLVAAQRLAARSDTLGFAALYASYYEGNDKVTPQQAAQFTRGVLAAAGRAEASLESWDAMGATGAGANGIVIDLGCGTAPLGIAMAQRGHRAIGVDVGMRWLILARRRAAEQDVDLPVVCANAEALPFGAGSCARVVGESVLENLADGSAALAECHRVLTRGGALCLTTANRHSLAPDPHLGVLAGGWWPERRLRAYAEARGQVFPVRQLYSVGELEGVLARAGFESVRLALPRFAQAQVASLSAPARGIVALYNVARQLPVTRDVVLRVGPTLVCTATRP